jgi:hypothetical protein
MSFLRRKIEAAPPIDWDEIVRVTLRCRERIAYAPPLRTLEAVRSEISKMPSPHWRKDGTIPRFVGPREIAVAAIKRAIEANEVYF